MHPLWTFFCAALLAGACVGPEVTSAARALSAMALGGLLWRAPRRRDVLWMGILVGAIGAWRMAQPLAGANAWDGHDEVARVVLIESERDGRARAWLFAPGLPTTRAQLVGLAAGVSAGSRIQARTRAWIPPRRRNPDDTNRRRRDLAKRVVLRARVYVDAEGWTPGGSLPWRERILQSFRSRMKPYAGASTSMWMALLWGDRRDLDPRAHHRFRDLGMAHLLALSGLHVGLLAGVWWMALGRWSSRTSWWPLLPLVGWGLLAGWTPSLGRALGMLIYAVAARRWARPLDMTAALAAVGSLEVCTRPWCVVSVGWWLSYAATAALLRVVPLVSGRSKLVVAACMGVVAQLATLPFTLDVFGIWVPWSALVHLAVAPVFAALMVGGLVLSCVVWTVPGWASAAGALLAASSHLFGFGLLGLERGFPSPWGHPGFSDPARWLSFALLAVWLVPGLWPQRRSRLFATVAALAALHAPLLSPTPLRWISFDVGQGDGHVLRQGRRQWMVVDAGPARAQWDSGERVLLPYLQRRSADDVTLVLSHGHMDHYGGASALMGAGIVAELWLARCDSEREWARSLCERAEVVGVDVRWLAAGDRIAWGGWWVDCLWPPATVDTGLSTNDRSLVLRLGPPQDAILFTGDLERAGERGLLAGAAPRGIGLLKVSHHGSHTGSGDELLGAVGGGGLALISCGRGNRYGHPHDEALARLSSHGFTAVRTDQRGALDLVWKDASGWQLRTLRPSP